MPRPKRTKIGGAKPATAASASAPPRRAVATQRPRQLPIEVETSQISDAENVSSAGKRPTRGATKTIETIAPTPTTLTAAQRRALAQAERRRESALERLDMENEMSDNDDEGALRGRWGKGAQSQLQSVQSSAPMPNVGNFKRRKREGSILGPRRAVERSVSVESEIAQSQDITNLQHDIPEPSPEAEAEVERPMSAFKARKRQGSILGAAGFGRDRDSSVEKDASINTPARGGSVLGGGGGMFGGRRRLRQGSILGTPGQRNGILGASGDDSVLGGLGDDTYLFAPEDESTPLNLPQGPLAPTTSQPSSPNPRKRRTSPLDLESSPTPGPAETQVPPSPSPQLEREIAPSPRPSSSPELSSLPVSPRLKLTAQNLSQAQQRLGTPEPPSSTFAPPHSSSSIQSARTPSPPPVLPRAAQNRQPARAARSRVPPTRRQPARSAAAMDSEDDFDLSSSPPSLTHSQDNRHAPIAATSKRKSKPIPAMQTTEQLQALLPRRRERMPRREDRELFEIDIEEEDEEVDSEVDELSMIPGRRRRGTVTQASATPAAATGTGRRVTKLKASDKDKGKGKGKGKSTYSKKAPNPESEKENADAGEDEEEFDPDDSLAPLHVDDEELPESVEGRGVLFEKKVSKELKKAKSKFADVDKWEMEFESVTAEASSQIDAR